MNGLEGLNIRAVFPFKFDEYVVGFKHSFTGFGRAPDTLFARRSFKTGAIGTGLVNAEYDTQSNVGSLNARWESRPWAVAMSVDADTKDKLKSVDIATVQNVQGVNVGVSAAFDVLSQKLTATTSAQKDGTLLSLRVDTANRNPEVSILFKFCCIKYFLLVLFFILQLSVQQYINENNVVNPTISLTTGDISYGWIRTWKGGLLRSTLHPGMFTIIV